MSRSGRPRGRGAGNRWAKKEYWKECRETLKTSNSAREIKKAMCGLNLVPLPDNDPHWNKYDE